MNLRIPEQLLGGHAAGILTEEEQAALYAAALKDQALFDALADEEALRELLADPAAKARLLAVLAPTPAPKVRPFWRRPAFLGLAASLFLLITTRAVLIRTELPQRARRAERQVLPQSPAEAERAAPKAEAEVDHRQKRTFGYGAQEATPAPTWQAKPSAEAPTDKLGAFGPAPTAPPPPPPPILPGRAELPRQERAVDGYGELKVQRSREDAASVAAKAPVGGAGGAAVMGGVSARENEALLDQSPQPKPAAKALRRQEGPTWTLTDLEGGRLRIAVRHGAGHPYLLLRQGTGVRVVPGRSEGTEGSVTTTYVTPWHAGEALDFYLLPGPTEAPERLPATGSINGYRARLRP